MKHSIDNKIYIMSIKEKLKKQAEDAAKLKDAQAQEVLDDDTLSNIEKLELISKHNLWLTGSCVVEPFTKFNGAFTDIIKSESDSRTFIFDDWFDMNEVDRHQIVDLVDTLTDVQFDIKDNPEMMFTILADRGSRLTYEISGQEFIDTLCEFCFYNKIVKFKYDW